MLRYAYIPSAVFLALRGDGFSRLVLDVLIYKRNKDTNRSHLMSKAEIAYWAGVSRRQAYRSLDKLVSLGLIAQVAVRRGEYMYEISCLAKGEVSEESVQAGLDALIKQFEEI